MMRALLIVSLLLSAFSAYAQKEGAMPVEQKEEFEKKEDKYIKNPEAIRAGHKLYLTLCSGCHGPHAEGGRGPNLIEGRRIRQVSNVELFEAIQKGVPGTDMPPFDLPEEEIWKLVAYVRSLVAPAYEQEVAGDPKAGKAIFYGKGGCTECHMIAGEGGFLGPDLTTIAAMRSFTQLEEAVLEPKKRTVEGYEPVIVTTSDGRKISGVAKNNSNYSIQVLDRDGNLHLLSKRNLRHVEFPRESWMPDNFDERLSEEELQNLLAFLSRQAVRLPEKKSNP